MTPTIPVIPPPANIDENGTESVPKVTEEDAKNAFKRMNIVYKFSTNGMWSSSTEYGEWLIYGTFASSATAEKRDASNWMFASFNKLQGPYGVRKPTVYGKYKTPAYYFQAEI